MNHRTALAGISALAVTAGLTVAGGLAAAPASAAVDPAPVTEGQAWLAGQLTDGLLFNAQFQFTDYGLSVDAGLALAEVGDTATVDTISAALAPQVRSYYTYDVAPGKTHVAAGSLAKAAAFAQVAGDDAAAYGGQDLIDQLEDRVDVTPAAAGRIRDVFFPEEPFEADFSNVIGQAFAARALDTAGSTSAEPVTDYLLAQQCTEGFFRSALGDTAAATCDADPAAGPSTDSTALAVLNLLGQADDTDVDAALDAAAAWLVSTQNADGSFGSDADITTANANSTGLAGWALGELGQDAAAEEAAVWLRGHQVSNTASCTPYAAADEGAIAYDDAAIAGADAAPINDETSDQFRRATSQALPALRSAPQSTTAVESPAGGYVRAGSTQRVSVSAAPGDLVCVIGGGAQRTARVPASGVATVAVRLPAGTGTRTFRVEDSTQVVSAEVFRALARKRLPVAARDVVARGSRVSVTVRGLAPREQVRVVLAGKRVAAGRATAAGRFQRSVTVTRSVGLGQRTIRVVGQFDTRVGTETVRVVRAR